MLLDQRKQVLNWWFIADGTVHLAADKCQICDIVSFSGCLAMLELSFREDMVELQAMLDSRMI
jgi:hypothetical protein